MRCQSNYNNKKTSFGMSYAITHNAKNTRWYTELEKNKKILKEGSNDVIAFFTKGLNGNLDCYAFKPSKYKLINNLQAKIPEITLSTRRFIIFAKEYFLEKHSNFGFNGTLWLKDKSVTNLLKKAKEDLIRRTAVNAQ